MNSKIQLQQNAGVFTADGKQVGHIQQRGKGCAHGFDCRDDREEHPSQR